MFPVLDSVSGGSEGSSSWMGRSGDWQITSETGSRETEEERRTANEKRCWNFQVKIGSSF